MIHFVHGRLKLPGRFYELNIHYGLFVGGLGDFREIFLGLWDNFRGCLAELNYNGIDVLAKAKDRDKTSAQVTYLFSFLGFVNRRMTHWVGNSFTDVFVLKKNRTLFACRLLALLRKPIKSVNSLLAD